MLSNCHFKDLKTDPKIQLTKLDWKFTIIKFERGEKECRDLSN